MPCGCKKGHGITLHGAGVRRKRKRGGMAISGAGYKKRRKGRRKKKGSGVGDMWRARVAKFSRNAAKENRARRGGGWGMNALMYGPVAASVASLAGAALRPRRSAVARLSQRFRGKLKGGGGRFLSGAVWHGYGKGSGMSVSGAGLYGKRLLGRGGSGRRQI